MNARLTGAAFGRIFLPIHQSAPAMSETPKKKRSLFGCLITLLVAGVLFGVLVAAFGIWFAGTNSALKIASEFVNAKSGGNLTFAENDTNLFAGRVHYKGIELTNPSRFTDKGFVNINEIKAVVNLGSATTDTIVVPEVIVDIGAVSLVGADDWMNDNNAMDFKKAFAPASTTPAQPEAKPAEQQPAAAGPKKHFNIGKLVIKLDRIRVLSHATTPGDAPKVIVDQATPSLDWEFTDITDENIRDKVYPVIKSKIMALGGDFANIGVALGNAVATKYLNDAAGQITTVTGQATKAVGDATKSVTDGLSDLFGGSKKDTK